MKKMDERLEQMLQVIAAQQHAQQQRAPQHASSFSQPANAKEDLWARAQQGDREAFEEYQRIIAREEYIKEQRNLGQKNYTEVQLTELSKLYPQLNDSSHPLTQKAQLAYQLLVNSGKPADRATLLEAAKTAIADSPQLIAELYSQGNRAREQARTSGVRSAHSGMTGTTYRQDPPRTTQGQTSRPVSTDEAALAGRMLPYNPKRPDEKTPEQRAQGAKKRFLERQQAGLSQVDPRLAPVIERLSEDF